MGVIARYHALMNALIEILNLFILQKSKQYKLRINNEQFVDFQRCGQLPCSIVTNIVTCYFGVILLVKAKEERNKRGNTYFAISELLVYC